MSFDNPAIAVAHELADLARVISKQYFRTALAVEQKNDASPVTDADKKIEAAMREVIEKKFPDHGIVGEEHGNIRPQSRYQWVLDPIDGTKAFIAGIPTFATLIALCDDGIPILGIIDQPVLQERWLGLAGGKTTFNGMPVTTSQKNNSSAAKLITTSTYYFSDAQRKSFETLRGQCASCLLTGDAYAYGLLASGHIDVVVDIGMKPYDYCALVPAIEGAGGCITDWAGAKLHLKSDGGVVAAASQALHKQTLSILKS